MPICHVGGKHGLALLAMAYRNSIIMPDNQEHTLNDGVVGYGVVVGVTNASARQQQRNKNSNKSHPFDRFSEQPLTVQKHLPPCTP